MMTPIKIYRFAEFVLNPAKRTLFREHTELRLRDKDFDFLLFLIESAPNPCSYDEIIAGVWNGTSVENNSIEKSVAGIRSILGDKAKDPRFIKTIRSKGYLFIADVAVIEINGSTDTIGDSASSPDLKISPPDFEPPPAARDDARSWLPVILMSLAALTVFAAIGIYLTRHAAFNSPDETHVLLTDDFSGAEPDPEKWEVVGKGVRLADGKAIVSIDETDHGGVLYSKYFAYDPAKPLIVTSRLKINPDKNTDDHYYFQGRFLLIPKLFKQENPGLINYEMMKLEWLAFGVYYSNYDYQSTEEIPAHGFFLVSPQGRPNYKRDYHANRISDPVEPLWNCWFEQKLIYNPVTGVMEFFINNEKKTEVVVGKMPELDEYKIQLHLTPYGWYTNHSMEIDYITVAQ